MELTVDQVNAALALSERDRVHLADILYGSVTRGAIECEDGVELSPNFKAELDRRMEDFTSGREAGIPWAEVQKEVDAILAEP